MRLCLNMGNGPMTLVCLLALALRSGTTVVAARQDSRVHIEHKPYHGWKDAYWISNDTVELVVVPQIGRVMRYAELNQPNLLWENASLTPSSDAQPNNWLNYGGDKAWVAPQSTDTWPPDPQIDPGPYQVEILPNGLTLTGPPSSKFKVRMTRQIVLAERGSKVSFTNALQNLGSARRISPWQVTQLDDPDKVVMAYRMTSAQQSGYYSYQSDRPSSTLLEVHGDELWLKRDPRKSRKFGSDGLKGEIRAVKGATIFHMVQDVLPNGVYPDMDSPQQVYLSADPLAYAELEQVGPLVTMETDEVAIQKVQWFLSNRIR
jgi:hypothetical protein